jgi:hypothetical protein
LGLASVPALSKPFAFQWASFRASSLLKLLVVAMALDRELVGVQPHLGVELAQRALVVPVQVLPQRVEVAVDAIDQMILVVNVPALMSRRSRSCLGPNDSPLRLVICAIASASFS